VYETGPEETRTQALKRKYSAVDEANNIYEEFYQVLRSRPYEEAADIFRRLRAGASVEALMQHVKSANLLLQLSVTPQTRYRYSMSGILDIPDILKTANNPYMGSIVYRMKSNSEWPSSSSAPNPGPGISDYRAIYDAPYHTARLTNVDIDAAIPSKWTNVTADDQVLRELLRCYFKTSYVFFPYFHKDCFLQDMVSGRRRFCSSLLVNSILAAGCVSASLRFTPWFPC
jgi:hypothetical protein